MPKYAYRGPAQIIDAFAPKLAAAGFSREGEFDAADLVVTYAPSASALEELYFGEGGVCQVARPGTCVVDMSPATPNFATEMNAVCTISDLQFIESPLVCLDKVSKTPFAKDNLETYLACECCDRSVGHDFLTTCFGRVEPVGSPGSAQLVRAGITLQSIAESVAVIEAASLIAAARRSACGLDVADLAPHPTSKDARFVLAAATSQDFDSPFTVEMLMAELSAAIMAADDYELILPQAEAAFHLIELLAVIGGSDKNIAAVSLVYGEDKPLADFGLDWSRAEGLFGEGEDDIDPYDADLDEQDYIDENFTEGAGFGYSVN